MPQVLPEHYSLKYDSRDRWLSYWYQIQAVARAGAQSVVEVGSGSGVLSTYLRQQLGLSVVTFDFDESRKPDVVGDVRQFASHFQPRAYDAVCAFEVLEHLPFDNFIPVLTQLAIVSRRYVILSLPHWGYFVQVRFWLKRWRFVYGRKITRPYTWQFDGQHYWEIGTRGYSLRRISDAISEVVTIKSQYFCQDYPYHYFFECQTKES
jgi:hypothetical protein